MKINDLRNEILFFFGFISQRYLNNIDTGGFFLFPHSLENLELNLRKVLSKNYVLTEDIINMNFENEMRLVTISNISPKEYKPNKTPYKHHNCESYGKFSKILKFQGPLLKLANKIYKKYDLEKDKKIIYDKIIGQTKNIKDLIFLKLFKLIISENNQNSPSNIQKQINEILNDSLIPLSLKNKISRENFNAETQKRWINSLISDTPRAFMVYYAHDFNSSGNCNRALYILFDRKITECFEKQLKSLQIDDVLIQSFNTQLNDFQNNYPIPLFDFKDNQLALCDIIIKKWNSNRPIYTFELEEFSKELQELIDQNLIDIRDDQILLNENISSYSGIKDYHDSKFYHLYENLQDKENIRIQTNMDKFIKRWLSSKISIENNMIKEKVNDFNELTEDKKKIKIFISYATEDADSFQLTKIVDHLEQHRDKIEKVFYWQRDTKGGEKFDDYMREKIEQSDFIMFFCSENSIASHQVQIEIGIAKAFQKKSMPIFKNINHVQESLKEWRGIKYRDDNEQEFKNTLDILFNAIIGMSLLK